MTTDNKPDIQPQLDAIQAAHKEACGHERDGRLARYRMGQAMVALFDQHFAPGQAYSGTGADTLPASSHPFSIALLSAG